MENKTTPVQSLVQHLKQYESGKMLSIAVDLLGKHQLKKAMESVQQVFTEATCQWKDQPPENPLNWLRTQLLNDLQNNKKRTSDTAIIAHTFEHYFSDQSLSAAQLRLLFLCCQAELDEFTQTTLILYIFAGLSLESIATIYAKSEALFEGILKNGIQHIEASSALPTLFHPDELTAQLNLCCQTLNAAFQTAYTAHGATESDVHRVCGETTRLSQLLLEHHPDHNTLHALLALMYFHTARFESRKENSCIIGIFEETDRSTWNKELILQGLLELQKASGNQKVNIYNLKAGIAAEHCMAKSDEDTDWKSIYYHYQLLYRLSKDPVYKLEMAIIWGNIKDKEEGIMKLEALKTDARLVNNHLLPASLGILYQKINACPKAVPQLEKAISLSSYPPEIEYLQKTLNNCK